MNVSIDRRVKMIPLAKIKPGDEFKIGGYRYVVACASPFRFDESSRVSGIEFTIFSYKGNKLTRMIDGIFKRNSILMFMPGGEALILECSKRELNSYFVKI